MTMEAKGYQEGQLQLQEITSQDAGVVMHLEETKSQLEQKHLLNENLGNTHHHGMGMKDGEHQEERGGCSCERSSRNKQLYDN